MRTMIRWAARLYPGTWRTRYGAEFDALIDDISPSFLDVVNVVGSALRVRAREVANARLLFSAVPTVPFRLNLAVSLVAHAIVLSAFALASFSYLPRMSVRMTAPLPPPAPNPPAQVTDPRVFPHLWTIYSSRPIAIPVQDRAMSTSVVRGVGIRFPSLPDAWTIDRRRSLERRTWPAQVLESTIVQRVLPAYPGGTMTEGAVSVLVEYLLASDGSVTVLRTSGPNPFADAARVAVDAWAYGPIKCDDHPCEVVTRVEVRFDGALAAGA
jgi:hypothetical protein